MPAWSTVPCVEEYNTRDEQYTENGFNAKVTLRCAYANRHALVQDMLFISRPAWGGALIGAYPTTASIALAGEGQSADGLSFTYSESLVTVTFSSAAEQQLISESLEPTAEFQVLDHTMFRWDSANGDLLDESEAPGRLIRGLNLVRTLYKVPSIPGSVLGAVGGVNNTAYSSGLLGLTFDAETLLYTPPTMNRTITTTGTQGWDITLKFRYQPEGWNRFWRASKMQYQKIYIAGGGQYRNYPLKAFAGLLA